MAEAPIPEVTIEGRRVTVSFDMPFMRGDQCMTPYHYEMTTVNRVPEVAIHLSNNLSEVRVECNGTWYTTTNSQLHGLKQFLPDENAFLQFWLGQDRDFFEKRISDLKRFFKGKPEAIKAITRRHVELLQADADAQRSALGRAIVDATQKVTQLEAAIAKAEGGAL